MARGIKRSVNEAVYLPGGFQRTEVAANLFTPCQACGERMKQVYWKMGEDKKVTAFCEGCFQKRAGRRYEAG